MTDTPRSSAAAIGKAAVVAVLSATAVIVALLLAGGWLLLRQVPSVSQESLTRVDANGTPVVMRTAGGRLEVATVSVLERFTRTDTQQFWGIDLGTTISQVQAPVVYRYHIDMATEWPMTIVGKTCIVRAGAVKPTLPVAFDTAATQKFTASGWARFNKTENLQQLERSMSTEMGTRAGSGRYLSLARDAGRETVAEFVTTWLLQQQGWRRDAEHRVIVLFPGEPLPPSPPPALAPRDAAAGG
ncbi:MAG: hypothetical protein ABIR94_14470 [Rubrivivax sp.]